MSSAVGSNPRNLLQRASTPLFVFLAFLLVPAAAFASVVVGIIVCVIAGVENSDLQARVGLAALLIGLVGSIYLLVRARRSPVSRPLQAQMTASVPPPLPTAHQVQNAISRTAEPTKFGGNETAVAPDSEDVEGKTDQRPIESNRIIDWMKVCTTPILIGFNASIVFVALGATLSPTLGTIGFVVVPIAFVSALTSHLMGTHFDIPSDRLSYPYFAWRLRLPLSGIRDANAQTINKRGIDVLASLGEKNPKHKTIHHYHVNLSGEFGARRLMFRSKFNRDQFLSILRAFRPDVRITRWS